jgi:hypothetical protein
MIDLVMGLSLRRSPGVFIIVVMQEYSYSSFNAPNSF